MGTIDRQSITATFNTEQLQIISGQITLDSGWSPYVQAQLTIKMPTRFSELDPTSNLAPQITIETLQQFADADPLSTLTTAFSIGIGSTPGTCADVTATWSALTCSSLTSLYSRPFNGSRILPEQARTFTLRVRSYQRSGNDEVTVDLASDETLLQESTNYYPSGSTLRELITSVFADAFFPLPTPILQPGTIDLSANASDFPAAAGVNAWDYLAPIITGAGLRLWCDELSRWYLDPDPTLLSTTLVIDEIIDFSETVTRDSDWCNIVTADWVDTAGNVLASANTSGFAGFPKIFHYTTITRPIAGIQALADAVLARRKTSAHQLNVETVTNLITRPGQRAQVTINGTTTSRRVGAVTFNLDTARMNTNLKDE